MTDAVIAPEPSDKSKHIPQVHFFIGTSGWVYDHWKKAFYPPELPKIRWFDYYLQRFNAVEINATFYHSFPDSTFMKWKQSVPESFRYVLKIPRWITHRKYLLEVEADIRSFCQSARLLEDRLGMFLLQIAPQTPYDPSRLEAALRIFDQPAKVAVEFRKAYWETAEIHDLLGSMGVATCSVDSPKSKLLDWVTGKNAYIRLHGRTHWYTYNYPEEELLEIAQLAHCMVESGADAVYIFFNNDFDGHAPRNAQRLANILRE